MVRTLAAIVGASILFSASASNAEQPAAPPGAAAQPLPPPAPPPGAGQPYPYYYPPPPYYLPPAQLPPRVIRWNEGETIPPGYHKGTERRLDLIISGSILFGSAWVPSAVVGSLGNFLFAIPVAGPFLVVGVTGGSSDGATNFWIVFDGVQQVAGVAMFIAGFAARRTVLLRDDVKVAKPWWLPAPMSFGKGSAGLGIRGAI